MIPRCPLAPFVRSFCEDHLVCRRNASPHTVRSYRDALKLFLRFTAARLKKPATGLLVTDIAEEVVNDTFWVVWRKARTFRGDSQPSTWILGIAYRKARNAFRTSARLAEKNLEIEQARLELQ